MKKIYLFTIILLLSLPVMGISAYTPEEIESYAPLTSVWLQTAQTWLETADLLKSAEEYPEAIESLLEAVSAYQNILELLKDRQFIKESNWTYTSGQHYRGQDRTRFFLQTRKDYLNKINDIQTSIISLYEKTNQPKEMSSVKKDIQKNRKRLKKIENELQSLKKKTVEPSTEKNVTGEKPLEPQKKKKSLWSRLFNKKSEPGPPGAKKPVERVPPAETETVQPVERITSSKKQSWWSKILKRKKRTEEELTPPERVKPLEPSVTAESEALVKRAEKPRTWVDSLKYFFKGKKEVLKKKKQEGTLGTVNLPYQSQLSISGRKTIAASLKNTVYLKRLGDKDKTEDKGGLEPTIEQQLQVRVGGRIGAANEDHININVQFDDAQQNANKQKIDISYTSVPRGTPMGDVKLIAQFGDVGFNLPNTRYLIFNKSLFGLKGTLDINHFDFLGIRASHVNAVVIGSRTKGKSGLKQFRGNQLLEPSIRDIRSDQFVPGIYRLEIDTSVLPLSTVTVWLDDRVGANDETENAQPMTVQSINGEAYSGNFHLLTTNEDYILDLQRGTVQFRRPPSQEEVIGVRYTRTGNIIIGDPTPLMIQDDDPTDTFYLQYQLRNVYSIGTQNLNREDPNFKVEIREKGTLQDRGPGGQTFLQIFGLDKDFDNIIDPEFINYEEGLIDFRGLDFQLNPFGDTTPFMKTAVATDSDGIIYTKRKLLNTVEDKIHYIIHVEYESKLDAILLNFNVVEGSDIVAIDGVPAERGIDYFIDYDVGLITIFNKDLIKPNSTVRIDYEYLPFGGGFEKTLLGAGATVNVNSNLSWGVSALGELGGTVDEQPDLRSTPDGKFVWDANISLRPFHSLIDLINRFKKTPMSYNLANTLNLSMSGEIAQSSFDPNSFGSAALSDMEDIQDELLISTDENAWLAASPPTYPDTTVSPRGLTINPSSSGRRAFSTIDMAEGFGHPDDDDRDEENSLKWTINFNDNGNTEWAAIRNSISNTFIDLSRHNSIELWVRAEGLTPDQFVRSFELFVDLGVVSEDADQDGVLDQEDANKDDILNGSSEDIGFDPAQPVLSGKDNAILDSEDMNNDDRLQVEEFFFTYGDLNLKADTFASPASFPPEGWIRYRIGLGRGIPQQSAATQPDLQLIKHVRLWIRERNTNSFNGSINILTDFMTILGNTWLDDDESDSILVTTVNTVDNFDYRGFFSDVKLFKNFRRELDEDIEQSLAVVFDQTTELLGNVGETRSISTSFIVPDPARAFNISRYDGLVFYAQHRATSGTDVILTFRFGDNDDNYFQWEKQLGASFRNKWDTVYIDLNELSKRLLRLVSPTPGLVAISDSPELSIIGSPSLGSVDMLRFIITNPGISPVSGSIWLNELHVEGARKVEGRAATANFSMGYKDYGSVSGGISKVDGQFKGVGILNDNVQDQNLDKDVLSRSISTNLALHKILWLPAKLGFTLPVSYGFSSSESKVDTGQGVKNAVTNVSQLSNDFSVSHRLSTSIGHKWLPRNSFSFSHTDNFKDYVFRGKQNRRDLTDGFSASTGYNYTFPKKLFKIIPTGRNLSVGSSYSYGWSKRQTVYESLGDTTASQFLDRNDSVTNFSHSVSGNVNFVPFSFLRLSSSYSNRQSFEESRLYRGLKSRSQSISLPIGINKFWGISPGINMNGSLSENFSQVTGSTDKRKSVSARAGFNFSAGVTPREIHRWLRFFDLNYNHRVDVSASYSNFPPFPEKSQAEGGLGKTTLGAIWDDYFKYKYFPILSKRNKTNIETGGDSGITKFRNSASTVVNHSISGGIYTWRPLSTRYNLSFIRNESARTASVSTTFSRNWGLNFSLATQQAFKFFQRWFRGSSLSSNVSSSWSRSESSLNTSLAPNYTFNVQFSPNFSFVHQFSYSVSRSFNIEPDPENKKSLSERLIPTNRSKSMSPSIRSVYTINKPFSLRFPLFGKVNFTNQFQISGSLSGAWNRTFQPETASDDPNNPKFIEKSNTLNVNGSLGASYRVRRNLTVNFSGSGGYFRNKFKEDDENYSYGVNSRVEWRF